MKSIQKKGPNGPRSFGENRYWGLFLISPWLLGLVLFKLVPILASLTLSLTDFYLLEPKLVQFVGLENYLSVLKDENARTALLQTLLLALVVIPVQTGGSIFLAALLSHPRLRHRETLRALFFIPSLIPATATMFMWQGFVNPTSGWLNRLILGPVGLSFLNQLYSRNGGTGLFILSSLWGVGPGFLILLSAMQGIAPEIHEAARIDGASRLRHFFSITLPLISPAIFFTLIINLTAVLGGAVMLDRGNNFNKAVSSYDAYIYYILFGIFRLGQASSAAWIFFLLVLILVLGLFGFSKYWVYFPDREA
jgi:multiple sugar transport system permease protein